MSKVWHITDYRALFTALAPNREGELEQVQYTQRHLVAPANRPEVQRHLDRLAALEEQLPLVDYLLTKEVFERLLDRSQRHRGDDKYLRGYVVDERGRPAALERICQMLRLSVAPDVVQKALRRLAAVGLIEKTELPCKPQPEPAPTPLPPETPTTDAQTSDKSACKKMRKKRNPQKTNKLEQSALEVHSKCTSSAPQVHLDAHESEKECDNTNRPEPNPSDLSVVGFGKLEEKNKSSAKSELKPNGQPESHAEPLTGAPGHARMQKPTQTRPDDGDATGTQRGGQAARDSKTEPDAPAAPTTTPPMSRIYPTATEPPAATINVCQRLDALYDRSGYTFAHEVYRALEVPYPADSPQGRNEIEAFATAWQRALSLKLPPSELNELWRKGVKEGKRLAGMRARRYKFRKSCESVWMYAFEQRALAAARRIGFVDTQKKCKAL